MKLSPNARDVVAIALAAEEAGADALVVSNTILGLKINTDTFRLAIGNKFGGISPRVDEVANVFTPAASLFIDCPV